MTRGPAKRDLEASLKAFRNPAPMTMAMAMASRDPVNEVLLRLRKPWGEMSDAERTFHSVMYFLGDTHNGGLEQTMTNSTGELTGLVVRFANEFGSADFRAVMYGILGLFSGHDVPTDHDARSEVISSLTAEEAKALGELSRKLCKLDRDIRVSLLAFLTKYQSSFSLE